MVLQVVVVLLLLVVVVVVVMPSHHRRQLGFDHHYPCPAGGVFPWKMSSAGNNPGLCNRLPVLKRALQGSCSSTMAPVSSGSTSPLLPPPPHPLRTLHCYCCIVLTLHQLHVRHRR